MFTRIAVAVLLISSVAFSQPKINAEFGRSTLYGVYFTDMALSYQCKLPIKKINIYSISHCNILTWQKFDFWVASFDVIEVVYRISQKFKYKNVYLKFEHYCCHPALSQLKLRHDQDGNLLLTEINPPPYWWAGAQETISIGYEHTFK